MINEMTILDQLTKALNQEFPKYLGMAQNDSGYRADFNIDGFTQVSLTDELITEDEFGLVQFRSGSYAAQETTAGERDNVGLLQYVILAVILDKGDIMRQSILLLMALRKLLSEENFDFMRAGMPRIATVDPIDLKPGNESNRWFAVGITLEVSIAI